MESLIDLIEAISPIAVVLIAAISSIYQAYSKIKSKRDSKKNPDTHVDLDVILNSHFFIRMLQYRNFTIPAIQIDHKLKSKMIKEFLNIKFETFYTLLQNFDYNKPETLISTIIDIGVSDYERKSRKAGIPEMFLEKFNSWHSVHATSLVSSIQSTLDSNLYSTMNDRYLSIFDNILNVFSMTIHDAEKTMNEFNGELETYLEDNQVGFLR